jgi:hypothetical protein
MSSPPAATYDVAHILGHCVAATFFLVLSSAQLRHYASSFPRSLTPAGSRSLKRRLGATLLPPILLVSFLESVVGMIALGSARGLLLQSAHMSLCVRAKPEREGAKSPSKAEGRERTSEKKEDEPPLRPARSHWCRRGWGGRQKRA